MIAAEKTNYPVAAMCGVLEVNRTAFHNWERRAPSIGRTGEGWLYLAAVQDTYSRAIVGWSIATHVRATLVVDALQMALARRRPEPGLIHHSDRAVSARTQSVGQYVSLAFGRAARDAGIAVSMGSRGEAYDNAVAETFFATLKKELVNRRSWPSRLELQSAVFEYIEASTTASAGTPPSGCCPRHLRTTTTLPARWLRTIAQTTTINNNTQKTKVSRKPGQVQQKASAFGARLLAELRSAG